MRLSKLSSTQLQSPRGIVPLLMVASVLFVACSPGPPMGAEPGPVSTGQVLISTEQRLYSVSLGPVSDDGPLPHPSPVPRTSFVDLARAGGSGAVYGITNSSLHALNVFTGRETLIGLSGVHDLTALAFDRTGRLFAGSASGHLYRLDVVTGAASPVFLRSTLGPISGDLAATADGTLYATMTSFDSDVLVEIHVDSGVVHIVGPTGYAHVYGLTFRGETLYGVTAEGELLTLDRRTGAARYVRHTGLTAVTGME
ncbi:hypothetical protein [Deinococcus sonorensis]|uniref:SMP-30/Gluconolactonase/LRE-like region domain-containing protein n=2 Tax=Deinococcus sonorensis TaxID=309891 RepID=A0AAU7U5G5_9DEIO